jgi:hypothetical protein
MTFTPSSRVRLSKSNYYLVDNVSSSSLSDVNQVVNDKPWGETDGRGILRSPPQISTMPSR